MYNNVLTPEIMEVEEGLKVTYTIKRVVRPGTVARLNSSYGWAGMEAGTIRVTRVINPSTYKKDASFEAYREAFIGEGGSFNMGDGLELDMEEIRNGIWIEYVYSNGCDPESYFIPLSLYATHTSVL